MQQWCTAALDASSKNTNKSTSLFSFQTVNSKHSSNQFPKCRPKTLFRSVTYYKWIVNFQSFFVLRSHNNTLQLLLYTHNWQITSRNTAVSFSRRPSIHHLRYRTPRGHKLYYFLTLSLSPSHLPTKAPTRRSRRRDGGGADKLPCVHQSPTLQFMPNIAYNYISNQTR